MKIERITDLERQYAMQSLDGQFEAHNNYKFVVRLEKAFAEKIGTKHSVGFVNGTATLHTALEAAGVTMGYDYLKCCRFASAVSALKCTGVGARESTPDLETTKNFLKENGYEL